MGCFISLPEPIVVEEPSTPSTLSHDSDTEEEKITRIAYDFQDIVDDKHLKYMCHYDTAIEEVFWGIGIENETYLTVSTEGAKAFRELRLKPERYSVDYVKNFKADPLAAVLQKAKELDHLTFPIYVNAHTFQKTDPMGQHRTFYDVKSTPNPAFTESLHDRLIRDCNVYRTIYDQSMVFDGDSIEFITQRFYNGTVADSVAELKESKQRFLDAITPYFVGWKLGIPRFPTHNHGFVSFLTTQKRNLSLCNSGTIHVNLTLPTLLRGGQIADKTMFANTHLNFIRHIQVIEPLLIACYGTPDVFSLLDPAYSLGSLRISRSRYISLQTFDTAHPINGKLLLMDRPTDPAFWYNQLADSPYHLNASIGYDVNFNKFKNHGVEIRFFDWFPEAYVEDVVNLLVLLAQHSMKHEIVAVDKRPHVVLDCVKQGNTARISSEDANGMLKDLGVASCTSGTPKDVLQHLANTLHRDYHDGEIIQKLSPNMKIPHIVDYNREAFQALYQDLFGRPELILRAEGNPLESRATISPCHIHRLLPWFNVMVEMSDTRCYANQLYHDVGATLVPRGYWKESRGTYVVGLKGIDAMAHASQTHLHFAHCFKGQPGSAEAFCLLDSCRFIDYEYMVDAGKRVISFCEQSGKIGCYLALMAYHCRQTGRAFLRFEEHKYRAVLANITMPRVLVIGNGTAGRAAQAVLDSFYIPYTVWDSKTDRSVHASTYEVVIHAIRLPDDSRVIEPFLTLDDLPGSSVRVICDITCDMGNPRNTLPIYKEYNTAEKPIQSVCGIDLIAIPYLPSMEPTVSSEGFSAILVDYLPELLWMDLRTDSRTTTLRGAYQTFLRVKQTLSV